MKKTFLLPPLLFLCFLTTHAQEGPASFLNKPVFQENASPQGSRQAGHSPLRTSGVQEDFGDVPAYGLLSVFDGQRASIIRKVVADTEGNIYAAGEFSNELSVKGSSLTDGAGRTVFIAKFAPDESLLWVQNLTSNASGFSQAKIHDLEINGTTVLVSGEYAKGGIMIGQESLPEATDANVPRPFVAALASDGNHLWARSFQELNTSRTSILGKNDNLALSGNSIFFRSEFHQLTELDYSGNILGTVPLPAGVIITDIEPLAGDLIISGIVEQDTQFGSFYIPRGLYSRIFLLRYDLATNDYEWVTSNNLRAGAPPAEDRIESIPVSLDVYGNEIYATGQFSKDTEIEWNGHTLYGSTGSIRNSPFAAKFDENGNALWLSLLEGDGNSTFGNMGASGTYLTYDTRVRSFTLLDSDGSFIKNTSFPSSYQDFIYTQDGYYLAGSDDYRFTFEQTDINLSALNWQVSDEIKAGFSQLDGLDLDSRGNLYHLGTVGGKSALFNTEIEGDGLLIAKTTANGTLIWSHLIENARTTSFGKNIKVNATDSTVYITGYSQEPTTILGDAFTPTEALPGFVIKLSAGGELEWIQNMPQELHGIEVDSENNVYVSGVHEAAFSLGSINAAAPQGGGDAFLIKTDPSGAPQWANFYSGNEYEYVALVAIGPNDEVYFSGEFPSRNITLPDGSTMNLSDTDGDIFLSKLTTDGNSEWSQVLGGGNTRWYGWPTSMEVTPEGNAALAGWVGADATFGDTTLTSPYRANNFIATILPDGSTKWASIIRTAFNPFNYNEMGVDEAGNIYVGGILNGVFEFPESYTGDKTGMYLAKYTAEGDFAYAKTIDASYYSPMGGFAISKEDDIFVNGYYTGEATFNGNAYNASAASAFLMNLVNAPLQPVAPEVPAEPIAEETSTFMLAGKGLADEVILRINPAEAVSSYRVEGNQLIINWNMNYSGDDGGRLKEIVEVSIEVAYRNNSGVSDFSEPFIVQLNMQPTGLEEELFGGVLKVYPNPSASYLKLELPQVQQGLVSVHILDISGKIVSSSAIPAGSNTLRLNTAHLPKGIYLLQFTLPEQGSTARRFVKD